MGQQEGGKTHYDEEVDQEGIVPLWEGCDEEESDEKEDEAPLASEG